MFTDVTFYFGCVDITQKAAVDFALTIQSPSLSASQLSNVGIHHHQVITELQAQQRSFSITSGQ